MWTTYNDQKDEIIHLLEKAENELQKVSSGGPDNKQLAMELQVKQDLSVALRKATETMLCRLRDLCAALSNVTVPEQKPLLLKEVLFHFKTLYVFIIW